MLECNSFFGLDNAQTAELLFVHFERPFLRCGHLLALKAHTEPDLILMRRENTDSGRITMWKLLASHV